METNPRVKITANGAECELSNGKWHLVLTVAIMRKIYRKFGLSLLEGELPRREDAFDMACFALDMPEEKADALTMPDFQTLTDGFFHAMVQAYPEQERAAKKKEIWSQIAKAEAMTKDPIQAVQAMLSTLGTSFASTPPRSSALTRKTSRSAKYRK